LYFDRVCIDYKDMDNLFEESTEARQMGYDGKQAIHPNQVDVIQKTFSPSEKGESCMTFTFQQKYYCLTPACASLLSDIERATKIKSAYEQSIREHKGAVGFTEGDSLIMIDAPMLKQADAVLAKARASKRV
jgi:citrate lyase subunit beta-like protein